MDEGTSPGGPIAIVMPVYNEASTIERTVAEVRATVMANHPCTLFISEDGSTDGTKEVLEYLARGHDDVRATMSTRRKGYPGAVRDALLAIDPQRFPLVLFMDSDGQYDPRDFEALWDSLAAGGADIVQGRRLQRREPLYRRLPSRVLRLLQGLLFRGRARDVTSAFRLMPTAVAQRIAAKVRFSRYNFWLEFHARALAEGLRIEEVPVQYRDREGSSQVYGLRRMPRVVWAETRALLRTWLEYRFREVVRYATVGACGALVILAGTWALVNLLGLHYLVGAAIAIEASIVVAFMLNDRWTFRRVKARRRGTGRLLSFNAVSLAGLALNLLLLFIFTHFLGIFYLVSESLAILGTFLFNYFTNLRFTWDGMAAPASTQPKTPWSTGPGKP